jgi:hypothetical protein
MVGGSRVVPKIEARDYEDFRGLVNGLPDPQGMV